MSKAYLMVGVSLAMVVTSATPCQPLRATATAASQGSSSLCRRAPELEVLPREAVARDQQRDERTRDDERMAAPMSPPPSPPPPPMPMPVVAAPTDSSEIAVTGSRVKASPSRPETEASSPSAPAAAEAIVPPALGRYAGGQRPPAGLLTAGDHDDLLNPLLYARYARDAARQLGQSVRDLPALDTANVLTVTVEDASGRPVPFAAVKLTCADGNSLTYAAQADGRVVFFPTLDRLGAAVSIESAGVSRRVDLGATGGQEQRLVIAAPARAVRKLDLMIALDTTGSMGDEISFLQSELGSIVDSVRARHPGLDVRVGLVAYRDTGDDFVTRTYPLTGDVPSLQRQLARQSGSGGGDMPEAMEQALIRAVGQQWRPDAIKSMLLVADAPPHDENVGRAFAAAEAARARRVHIVPIAASGVDDSAQYLMRAMAAATQSRYVFLTDDSGIGNPHAEPSVDCYVVTKLASAIRRVLDSQLSGQRIEPFPDEVIRVTGQYDHGRCVLPPDWDRQ